MRLVENVVNFVSPVSHLGAKSNHMTEAQRNLRYGDGSPVSLHSAINEDSNPYAPYKSSGFQKPKKQIIEELKEQYKEETQFSVSTLLTLIPKNYVAPGEGDRECNVCVKHTNEENLTRKLRAFDPSLPTSSRELSALVMCPPSPTNVFSVMEPLTWNQKCSLR